MQKMRVKVDFIFTELEGNKLSGKAILTYEGKEYVATYSEIEADGDAKDKSRQLKRIYSQVFLEVLEEATGMKQSWGILTGIQTDEVISQVSSRRT